ncbi:MAG: KGK domain-containing protein [Merismopediaceae bacterium]|nr:KGK domain-containing protein [Merismopediaceae bacterium]
MAIAYNPYLQSCRDDDVITLSNKLYKLGDVKENLNDFFESDQYNHAPDNLRDHFRAGSIEINTNTAVKLLTEGIECEILKIASEGWKKGKLKIKISLEFIPDPADPSEYQSPLDEIRREIQERNL